MSDANVEGGAPRGCVRCLYVEGMGLDFLPSVVPRRFLKDMSVDDDGVCSLCRAYERTFQASALERERDELVALARTGPVVLALSGGKDSLSTLWVARTVLALDVRAVVLDNGFIPAAVLEVARAACAKLAVPLEIARLDDAAASSFAALVAGDEVGRDLPCSACSRHLESALVEVAARTGASALVTGTNFFASWGARPSSFNATRSRLAVLDAAPASLPVVHLPYALGLKRADVERNLDALGVRPVQGLAGSTNCRVPGLLQTRAAQRGHAIDVEDKLLEVLVGHLPREDALH